MHQQCDLTPRDLNPFTLQGNLLGQKGKELSKSSVSAQRLVGDAGLSAQIVQLKEKAHQSFMQVIQMQQLHEQQMQELRNSFQTQEQEYQSTISELQTKTKQLEGRVKQIQCQKRTIEKNLKHHSCTLDQDDLSIDNIELITCREESRLDDSAIINFTEIVTINPNNDPLPALKHDIRRELERIATPLMQGSSTLQNMVEKVFEYIGFMKQELMRAGGQEGKAEGKDGKSYESLQKESNFMSEHIKRLSAEKMRVEKRLVQSQRESKTLEGKVRQLQSTLSKKQMQETSPHVQHTCIQSTSRNSSASNPSHLNQYGQSKK